MLNVNRYGTRLAESTHPIHLHGHHFYVVKTGYPHYHANNFTIRAKSSDIKCQDEVFCDVAQWADPTWKLGNIGGLNANASLKDTIFVPGGGYVVIRFRSNNVGYWFMHCHVETHQSTGLALLIQEGSHEQISALVKRNDVHMCYTGFEENWPRPTENKCSSRMFDIKNGIIFIIFINIIYFK